MSGPMRRPRLDRGIAEKRRVEQVAVEDTKVMGRIRAEGVGEFLVDISFPVLFAERPFPFFGAPELIGDVPEVEHFPEVELAVYAWIMPDGSVATDGVHFAGAKCSVRVSGRSRQGLWVPYRFEGRALTSINVEAT